MTNGDTDHDEGYDNMTEDGVFDWVRPAMLVKTQASENFNGILDFVFASRDTKTWAVSSTILVEPGDFPDDDQKSDHRPVRARFNLSAVEVVSKQDILDKIAQIQQQLEMLKQLTERLP